MTEKENKKDNIYQKLSKARQWVRENTPEKEGWNDYGKYKFFKPEQINVLVSRACEKFGLLTIFNLVEIETPYLEKSLKILKPINQKPDKNNKEPNLIKKEIEKTRFRLEGKLRVIDIDTKEEIIFQQPTKIPEITATNASQKLGGTVTFASRYLKTTAFEITENYLDFNNEIKDENCYKKEPPIKELPIKDENFDPYDFPLDPGEDPFAGTEKKEKKEGKYHNKIRNFLKNPDNEYLFSSNQEKIDFLERQTSYTNKQGDFIAGVTQISNLTPGRAETTWHKIEKEFGLREK